MLRIALLGLALLAATPAASQPLRVMESTPAARSVMDGARQEIFVRFDHPVDHNASRLEILQGEAVLRVLRPRLGASPDTLYAATGGLPPGAYVLHWVARAQRDGTMTEGRLDFTVR